MPSKPISGEANAASSKTTTNQRQRKAVQGTHGNKNKNTGVVGNGNNGEFSRSARQRTTSCPSKRRKGVGGKPNGAKGSTAGQPKGCSNKTALNGPICRKDNARAAQKCRNVKSKRYRTSTRLRGRRGGTAEKAPNARNVCTREGKETPLNGTVAASVRLKVQVINAW